jgi:hypothetical protein
MALLAVFKPFLNDPVTGVSEPQATTAGVGYRLRNSQRFRPVGFFGSGY